MAKPEKSFRIGSCTASIFVNKRKDKGGEFRSVKLQRRYKDGNEWKSSTSFTLSDIPEAVAVLQLAMHHVATRESKA